MNLRQILLGIAISSGLTLATISHAQNWHSKKLRTPTSTSADTTAPTTPSGLAASAVTSTSLTLSWNASTDNVGVTGYQVYRDGTQVASPGDTSASISGLSAGVPYSFTVSAVDAAGNVSALSAPLSVTTPAPAAPATPVVTLAVQGAPNLPFNGTSTQVTVGFAAGTPTKVGLSRDGFPVFATWPTDSFFTLSADGKSLTGSWCITSSCWGNVSGAHVLNVVATYAGASTASASVNLNVVDTSTPTPITSSNCANPAGGYEGFGRNTTGGVGQPVYHVTNLNDSGAGSFRDAISQGNRCVVFDIGGTINLLSYASVRGANITIDGFTAPSPGITLRNYEMLIHGYFGASNVVVRGLRSRDAFKIGYGGPDKGFEILGTSNIVLDHVSVYGAGKDAFSVTDSSHDVTVQWSIFAEGAAQDPTTCPTCTSKGALIKYDTTRVTVHHNLFINEYDRQPQCANNDTFAPPNPPEAVCDLRNNLMWNYTWATAVREYGTGNVVNNYYYSPNPAAGSALQVITGGVAYVTGNYYQTGPNMDGKSNRATPFAAPAITQTDAITAAHQIVAQAGARGPRFGLDAIDLARILIVTPVQ